MFASSVGMIQTHCNICSEPEPTGIHSLVFARAVVMATVSPFAGWLICYNVAYLCVDLGYGQILWGQNLISTISHNRLMQILSFAKGPASCGDQRCVRDIDDHSYQMSMTLFLARKTTCQRHKFGDPVWTTYGCRKVSNENVPRDIRPGYIVSAATGNIEMKRPMWTTDRVRSSFNIGKLRRKEGPVLR
jgi:hypothetical protein